MGEKLLSVGIDLGTTTTQLVVSELLVENEAASFMAPHLAITGRKVRYESPIHETPLTPEDLVDGSALRQLVLEEYRLAGITREAVDTGAVIVTGETARKENAARVLEALADLAGDFVVATAGPELESLLAAKGAGAPEQSRKCPGPLLHMDIGGGTSNFALLEDGKVLRTGCVNVGGRLLKLDSRGKILWRSPALKGFEELQPGTVPGLARLRELVEGLTRVLEMAAGLRAPGPELQAFTTAGTAPFTCEAWGVSFSGGVADCILQERPPLAYGDLGPLLGAAIRESPLFRGRIQPVEHTIRATVLGAGCHSTQLSGSTVFCRNVQLPLKNLPAAVFEDGDLEHLGEAVRQARARADGELVLSFPEKTLRSYQELGALARQILAGSGGHPIYVCLAADQAQALGQLLGAGTDRPVLALDGLELTEESFLDVGSPVGPAFPVVIKTLVLRKEPA